MSANPPEAFAKQKYIIDNHTFPKIAYFRHFDLYTVYASIKFSADLRNYLNVFV